MKTLAKLAVVATLAAAPLAATAQEANDPFVSTQASAVPALAVLGGMAVIIAVAAADGTN
ncbi:hypothetical protein [Ponticoccus alexandrii]|uniref:Ferrochelatase n=1 Tax=Ponticoccus alexandrii TaxID=1943633 RepID=A0ABX7FB04_9RHOB|nr:hypothetical protein [Ponticoccus alexandrii]ETA50387.1 hypothetical protein P279_20025 [Rhodobacteraceae bacterium PD-2]QRF67301.1 hypothetical protein GQA70_13875 [Ponticoccus alexandrii]